VLTTSCTGTSMLLLVETVGRLESPCIKYYGSVRIIGAIHGYLSQGNAMLGLTSDCWLAGSISSAE
jgi:hypothetical protein